MLKKSRWNFIYLFLLISFASEDSIKAKKFFQKGVISQDVFDTVLNIKQGK
jgi:hypothetical protein